MEQQIAYNHSEAPDEYLVHRLREIIETREGVPEATRRALGHEASCLIFEIDYRANRAQETHDGQENS